MASLLLPRTAERLRLWHLSGACGQDWAVVACRRYARAAAKVLTCQLR